MVTRPRSPTRVGRIRQQGHAVLRDGGDGDLPGVAALRRLLRRGDGQEFKAGGAWVGEVAATKKSSSVGV